MTIISMQDEVLGIVMANILYYDKEVAKWINLNILLYAI